MVATVRIATSLEARLQAANTARTQAEHAASLADKRAIEVKVPPASRTGLPPLWEQNDPLTPTHFFREILGAG